jgi:hypothetical protein
VFQFHPWPLHRVYDIKTSDGARKKNHVAFCHCGSRELSCAINTGRRKRSG